MFSCDDIIMNLVLFQVIAHNPRISEPLMDHFHRNKCFNVVSNPGITFKWFKVQMFQYSCGYFDLESFMKTSHKSLTGRGTEPSLVP